ncbi:MAG: mechanosensitive ion channel [bacterium]|nr:mechanosensitive ion channel [bacterium]
MKKIKPVFIVMFLLISLSGLFAQTLQTQVQEQAPSWMPQELQDMEIKFLELMAQADTLDIYAPENFPDFKELEKINQLVELLDFNHRKFKLLIEIYNKVEDEIFPYLVKFSKEHPTLNSNIYGKLKEFAGKNPKSILKLQERINLVALQMERLEKRIERVHLTARKKELESVGDQSMFGSKAFISITSKINRLEEDRRNFQDEIEDEEERLKVLQEQEAKKTDKIQEKTKEIKQAKKQVKATRDRFQRLLNRIAYKVRAIRLNGLEIPQLNTVKTFVYLSKNTIKTLREKIRQVEDDVTSLRERRKEELIEQFIHGVIIISIALILIFLIMKVAIRISKKVIARVEASENIDDHRKQRYQTLSTVVLSFVKILSWSLAVLWVLGELDVDYGPFLVAAGGISLAIGFGAQSLVKDVVTGFFLLMEEQFALGDSIEVNGKIGTVEKISLRTIKFRGLDGTLHIIPNGNISSVSNKTYQWSRAVVKVGVSYDENPDKVLELLGKICADLAADPKFNDMLIGAPIAQGILSLGDSAIEFRILAKTKPGDNWPISRELNIRIKKACDENGIDIPYNYINVIDKTEKK